MTDKENDTLINEVDKNNTEIINHTIQTYEEEISKLKANQKNKRGIFSYLLTGTIGGLVAALIIVVLLANNLIPTININQSQQGPLSTETKTMSNDLTDKSNIADTPISEVSKAVVGIKNITATDPWSGQSEGGTGSGIIYKKEDGKAFVVTNHHVINNSKAIEVELSNKKVVQAKLLGSDPLTDLAVLEMSSEDVEAVADFHDSDKLEVGETVIAIGNPLGSEFAGSVTKGIISGLNRSVEVDTNGDKQPDWVTEVIQTDAAINPGNSGGALINTKGKVVGINSMKVAQSSVEGIGLAIPSNTAQPVIKELEKSGEVVRPALGVAIAPLHQVPNEVKQQIQLPNDVQSGMVIANVEANSPAQKAGLKQFDIITKINKQDIASILDIKIALYTDVKMGDDVTVEYIRQGKHATTSLTLTH